MDRVGSRHIKFRARNVSRRRKIDLPDCLLVEPLLDNIFRHFSGLCQFFDGRDAFPVALAAVVDFGEFGVHLYSGRQKFKENEKPRIRALARPRRQKEARPVSAAHLAGICPRISALWAESTCSRGGPGCRA